VLKLNMMFLKVMKIWLIVSCLVLNACSVISVVDTAVDVVLLPVKVGVAAVEIAIPDDD